MSESSYLVDTNILVYAYDAGETSKRDRAIQVLDEVFEIGRGALTTQVLSEFFVTVTRKLAPPLSVDEAERSVRNYIAHGPYSMSPRAMSRSRFGVCDGTDSRTGIASFGRSTEPRHHSCAIRGLRGREPG